MDDELQSKIDTQNKALRDLNEELEKLKGESAWLDSFSSKADLEKLATIRVAALGGMKPTSGADTINYDFDEMPPPETPTLYDWGMRNRNSVFEEQTLEKLQWYWQFNPPRKAKRPINEKSNKPQEPLFEKEMAIRIDQIKGQRKLLMKNCPTTCHLKLTGVKDATGKKSQIEYDESYDNTDRLSDEDFFRIIEFLIGGFSIECCVQTTKDALFNSVTAWGFFRFFAHWRHTYAYEAVFEREPALTIFDAHKECLKYAKALRDDSLRHVVEILNPVLNSPVLWYIYIPDKK